MLPDMRFDTNHPFTRSSALGDGLTDRDLHGHLSGASSTGSTSQRTPETLRGRSGGVSVDEVDALAGTFLGGGDDVQPQALRDVDLRTGRSVQFAVAGLHVRQPVDVELEHLGGVLHAQPVTGAQLLIDPDT